MPLGFVANQAIQRLPGSSWMQNLNHAMDLVRRGEEEDASTLKKSRYL